MVPQAALQVWSETYLPMLDTPSAQTIAALWPRLAHVDPTSIPLCKFVGQVCQVLISSATTAAIAVNKRKLPLTSHLPSATRFWLMVTTMLSGTMPCQFPAATKFNAGAPLIHYQFVVRWMISSSSAPTQQVKQKLAFVDPYSFPLLSKYKVLVSISLVRTVDVQSQRFSL